METCELEAVDKMKQLSAIYPMRNLVAWERSEGKVTLVYKKKLNNFEKRLQNRFGGPSIIRRPLDDKGSRIWELSDGRHSLAEICMSMEREFREKVEPVVKRVWAFTEILLRLNLVILRNKPLGMVPMRVKRKGDDFSGSGTDKH